MFRWLEVLFKGGGFRGGDPEALNGGGGHHGSLLVLYSYRPSADWLGWRHVFARTSLVFSRSGVSGAKPWAGCSCQLPGPDSEDPAVNISVGSEAASLTA